MANNTLITLFVGESVDDEVERVSLKMVDGKFEGVNKTFVPQQVVIDTCTLELEQTGQIPSGRVVIEIENLMDTKNRIWMIHYSPDHVIRKIRS